MPEKQKYFWKLIAPQKTKNGGKLLANFDYFTAPFRVWGATLIALQAHNRSGTHA